jgi:hypothetical protein
VVHQVLKVLSNLLLLFLKEAVVAAYVSIVNILQKSPRVGSSLRMYRKEKLFPV